MTEFFNVLGQFLVLIGFIGLAAAIDTNLMRTIRDEKAKRSLLKKKEPFSHKEYTEFGDGVKAYK